MADEKITLEKVERLLKRIEDGRFYAGGPRRVLHEDEVEPYLLRLRELMKREKSDG